MVLDLETEIANKQIAEKYRFEDLERKKPPRFYVEEYERIPKKYSLKDWAENFALRDFYLNHNPIKNKREYVHFLSIKQNVSHCYKNDFYDRYEPYSYLYSGRYTKNCFIARVSNNSDNIGTLNIEVNIASNLNDIQKQVSKLVKKYRAEKKCTTRSFNMDSYINNKYLAIADLLIYGQYCNIKVDANMINEYIFHKDPKEDSTISILKKDTLKMMSREYINNIFQKI
ncbi:hypothetical protein [Francisella sp. TX07-6608]|uniref:hypothetical protein n=1 Tax=Francisella sp. TX07-6608 TaxID=573568 RepID=UPI0008F9A465|nr:hypothetical protein [Francisella sp. TX07-6608]OIN83062.1 hypothetical protein KX00_708 [Francisella sp. TX07-6608]